MKWIWLCGVLIPGSFWDAFQCAQPLAVMETPYWVHHRVLVPPK